MISLLEQCSTIPNEFLQSASLDVGSDIGLQNHPGPEKMFIKSIVLGDRILKKQQEVRKVLPCGNRIGTGRAVARRRNVDVHLPQCGVKRSQSE